jgi:RNA polymerase sigma-70 factor (ECF subfamily)
MPISGSDSPTPISLLEQMRANDPAAWERLIGLYRPLVLYWCGRGGVRPTDAEDVMQEVFAAAAASMTGFRRDQPGDTFRGWLRGIARNCVLLHFRRNKGRPNAEGGSDAWNALQSVADPLTDSDAGEEVEVSQIYRWALEQVRQEFEAKTWEAFWLTTVEGRLPAALVDQLSMSPAAIRQAKSRVLRRLKKELGDVIV